MDGHRHSFGREGQSAQGGCSRLGESDHGGQNRMPDFPLAQYDDYDGDEIGKLKPMAASQDLDSLAFLFDLDGTWWIASTSMCWPGVKPLRQPASNCRSGGFIAKSA
ncbi:hypothetical protein NSPZN2_11182 [Nitrospira defluvii]|uniref:Uncharacterized protein n=1 Tax=Nitrospira defluvii TaxID=330214 RepID=A0ABM8QQU6_9BACT|nr:hypothetical protein NSPZN2_11182 [Nitrospira defluvii]